MKKYVVVAETGADIPREYAERYGIAIVPMHVAFGTDVRDDGTFPAEEICDYYKKTGKIPTTSGSNPEDFMKVFDMVFQEHPNSDIIYMAYSAVTTCSYQSAKLAAEGNERIHFFDTKQVTIGQGAAAIRLAQQIEAHPEWSLDEVKQAAEQIIRSMNLCFTPSNLDFLRAGGRVSNAAALCGNLLSIHPKIEIVDGYLKATKKYRGKMEKVVEKLVTEFFDEKDLEKDELWMGSSIGFSDELKERVIQMGYDRGFQQVNWMTCGDVITTHGGPNAFCICGFSKLT